jgi:hypothetical protein
MVPVDDTLWRTVIVVPVCRPLQLASVTCFSFCNKIVPDRYNMSHSMSTVATRLNDMAPTY